MFVFQCTIYSFSLASVEHKSSHDKLKCLKMAVSSVVILMVLFTSVLQVDGSDFSQYYSLHKALESALITEEALFTMRQAFFPVVHSSAQETQQVRINICVEIAVDQALNSTTNDSCIAVV